MYISIPGRARHHTCLSRNGHGGKPQPMEEILQKLVGGLSDYPFNGFQASKVVQDFATIHSIIQFAEFYERQI